MELLAETFHTATYAFFRCCTPDQGKRLQIAGGRDFYFFLLRRANVNAAYAVENTSAGFVVRVQNPGAPFVLGAAADNTLRGSGSTTVNGRLISTSKC